MIQLLTKTKMFEDINEEIIPTLCKELGAYKKTYQKDEVIVFEGDTVNDIGIVISGCAQSSKMTLSGKKQLISLHQPCNYIAILTALSKKRKCPMSVIATRQTTVLHFPIQQLFAQSLHTPHQHEKQQLIINLFDSVAERALELHDRNDVLIMPTIRDKVWAYLSTIQQEQKNDTFTIPFNREGLAEYLNVERSALSRELSWMQRDGLIVYHKNTFTLY